MHIPFVSEFLSFIGDIRWIIFGSHPKATDAPYVDPGPRARDPSGNVWLYSNDNDIYDDEFDEYGDDYEQDRRDFLFDDDPDYPHAKRFPGDGLLTIGSDDDSDYFGMSGLDDTGVSASIGGSDPFEY